MAVWLNLRAIDESSRSLKAIINRVIISFRDKNAAFACFCNKIDDIYDKNTVFALKLAFQIKKKPACLIYEQYFQSIVNVNQLICSIDRQFILLLGNQFYLQPIFSIWWLKSSIPDQPVLSIANQFFVMSFLLLIANQLVLSNLFYR